MIVTHEKDAVVWESPEPCRRTLKVLLSPALQPQLQELALGFSILPPGGRSDEHAHVEGEAFFVISGSGRIKTPGEEAPLIPGAALWSPAGEAHQLINDGEETLKILWVLCPPGREEAIVAKGGTRA